MKWQMLFDKVEKTGDIKKKIEKKFSGLELFVGRFRSKLQTGFVKLSKGERWGYKVKTMFRLPGKEIVAEGKSETLLSAIDDVYGKASREIKRYLEKIKDKRKR